MSYIYKNVVVVGIDGMGNFNKEASTPNMDRIFENGAKTLYGISLSPTISAQNWGAMLLGAQPEVHGLTNSIVSQYEYGNDSLPSFFASVRKAFPDAFLCSCCNWNPINHGIIEQNTGVEMHTADNDEILTEIIEECVGRKPKLLFIQFDDVDGAGHSFGYGTKGHLEQITVADGYVGRVYDAYKKAGLIDETLFIVIADHGGYDHGHGGYTDGEKYIFFALAGKTVINSDIPYAQTKDINAVVLHAFGLDVPEYDISAYSSQIPLNVFEDVSAPYIKPAEKENYCVAYLDTPDIESENGLYSFFERSTVKTALFFDNNINDATGNTCFIQNGQVKFYSNGIRGSYGEMGSIGIIECNSLNFGSDSFTIAVWLKIDKSLGNDCYVCGNNAGGSPSGFALYFNRCDTLIKITGDEPELTETIAMPFHYDVASGWLHTIYIFDRVKNTVDIYYNFEHKKTAEIPLNFRDIPFDGHPFTVGDSINNKCNKQNNYIFNADDLIIFNKALSENEVKKLADYYNL